MVFKTHMRGKFGAYLVLFELFKRGIDAIATPRFWPFDIFTRHGIMIEVKFSNKGTSKGGSGYSSERFTFRNSPIERSLLDFLILVLNTHKGYLFYIIPKKAITSNTIAFNPFSPQESQYEKYLNRWDLLKKLHDSRVPREKFQKYLEEHSDFFNTLHRFQVQRNREEKLLNNKENES